MKKFLPILLSAMFVASFAGTALLSFAAEDEVVEEEGTEEVTDAAAAAQDFLCGQLVTETAMFALDDYKIFLDTYFQNIENSSSQVVSAMEYYRYVKDDITNTYETYRIQEKRQTLEVAYKEEGYCRNVKDDYLELAKNLLQSHSIQSANSKSTFAIIDSLKGLNENMDNLSDNFTRIFPQKFVQMDNALPCYARACITR